MDLALNYPQRLICHKTKPTWCTTSWNSQFLFFSTCRYIKAKELSLAHYSLRAGMILHKSLPFPRVLSLYVKFKQPRSEFGLGKPSSLPTMIIVTQRAPFLRVPKSMSVMLSLTPGCSQELKKATFPLFSMHFYNKSFTMHCYSKFLYIIHMIA